jgi:hypothetical protein
LQLAVLTSLHCSCPLPKRLLQLHQETPIVESMRNWIVA